MKKSDITTRFEDNLNDEGDPMGNSLRKIKRGRETGIFSRCTGAKKVGHRAFSERFLKVWKQFLESEKRRH
ncbi:hypothetical protein [Bacillus methanolicus]|uniref:hypothetical protein n=1 Tax=Bacillus methanolicus TaxID=1471 RepID=UPI00200F14BE|nr:hypothetical protein [Bacillus methanolicus]